jgi:alanine dehydrogenase
MLKNMMDGSVIVDVAVDQGGCVETCRPTSHEDPIFEIEGVIHYCVPNMPGAVPFTSTIALTNSTLPYIQQVANDGLERAVCESKPLLKAMNVHEGKITHKGVANAFKMEFIPPEEIFSLVY